MRDARRNAALVVCGLVWPLAIAAQDAGVSSAGSGAWHAARELRASLTADASVETLVRALELEVLLGRPDLARTLLEGLPDERRADPALLAVRGDVAMALGAFEDAGRLYAAAAVASAADEARAGVLAARGGAAFAAAGLHGAARELFAQARRRLRPVAGWIAVREAAVADDTTAAFRLLVQAPPAARQFSARTRAARLLWAGDTASAIQALASADAPGQAAVLAVATGDTALGRRLAYAALRLSDTSAVRVAVELVREALPPGSATEYLAVAAAHLRLRLSGDAVRFVERAIALGDSTAQTGRLLGDVLVENRQSAAAIDAYARAAERGGPEGTQAAYQRARLLVQVGRRTEGYAALLDFAEHAPQHPNAALAIYLVADARREGRRLAEAESLYREVGHRWPRDEYAARARFQLATVALARADTAAGERWYRAEVEAGGAQQHAARHMVARLRARAGDTAEANAEWRVLAQRDPVGYYGTMARRAAGLDLPAYPAAPPPSAGPSVAQRLEALDLLDAMGWTEEADALVRHAMQQAPAAPEELLALGGGLIERGRVAQGVTLGWRATPALPLIDPRVLRVIWPWPMRALIEEEAAKYDLDPYLLAALIRQESTFRPAVISRAGATGLMQLMPGTATGVARRLGVDWDDRLLAVADANLHLGAAHLAGLLRRYQGSEVLSLAAYNAGGSPVDRWIRAYDAADTFGFVEQIPYLETRGYVRSVLRNRDLYRALYPPDARPDAAVR